jgi:hypothetical protein
LILVTDGYVAYQRQRRAAFLINFPPNPVKSFRLGDFLNVYRPLADEWAVYDNSAQLPQLLERWP